jgi:hypothetical protein
VIEIVDQRAQLEAADQIDGRCRHDLVVAVDQISSVSSTSRGASAGSRCPC